MKLKDLKKRDGSGAWPAYASGIARDTAQSLGSLNLGVDVESMRSIISRHPNYDDEMPKEMFTQIKKAASENDVEFFNELMRTNVRLVREEIIESLVAARLSEWLVVEEAKDER